MFCKTKNKKKYSLRKTGWKNDYFVILKLVISQILFQGFQVGFGIFELFLASLGIFWLANHWSSLRNGNLLKIAWNYSVEIARNGHILLKEVSINFLFLVCFTFYKSTARVHLVRIGYNNLRFVSSFNCWRILTRKQCPAVYGLTLSEHVLVFFAKGLFRV